MGDAPSLICYLVGTGSYKSQLLLSSAYETLGDHKQALRYCKMALKNNPTYKEAYRHYYRLLCTNKPDDSLRKKLERYAPPQKSAKNFLMLSDVFYTLQRYDWALLYARKARKLMDNPAEACYDEGVCLFFMGQYGAAEECLKQLSDTAYAPKAAYFSALCARFDNRLYRQVKRFENIYFIVLNCFENLIEGKKCETLAEDVASSEPFLDPIFSLLDLLLVTQRFEWFDKARRLLNLITNDTVLMRLGKLYYKRGFLKPAYTELVRSIKLTGKIDAESLDIMKIVLASEKN